MSSSLFGNLSSNQQKSSEKSQQKGTASKQGSQVAIIDEIENTSNSKAPKYNPFQMKATTPNPINLFGNKKQQSGKQQNSIFQNTSNIFKASQNYKQPQPSSIFDKKPISNIFSSNSQKTSQSPFNQTNKKATTIKKKEDNGGSFNLFKNKGTQPISIFGNNKILQNSQPTQVHDTQKVSNLFNISNQSSGSLFSDKKMPQSNDIFGFTKHKQPQILPNTSKAQSGTLLNVNNHHQALFTNTSQQAMKNINNKKTLELLTKDTDDKFNQIKNNQQDIRSELQAPQNYIKQTQQILQNQLKNERQYIINFLKQNSFRNLPISQLLQKNRRIQTQQKKRYLQSIVEAIHNLQEKKKEDQQYIKKLQEQLRGKQKQNKKVQIQQEEEKKRQIAVKQQDQINRIKSSQLRQKNQIHQTYQKLIKQQQINEQAKSQLRAQIELQSRSKTQYFKVNFVYLQSKQCCLMMSPKSNASNQRKNWAQNQRKMNTNEKTKILQGLKAKKEKLRSQYQRQKKQLLKKGQKKPERQNISSIQQSKIELD